VPRVSEREACRAGCGPRAENQMANPPDTRGLVRDRVRRFLWAGDHKFFSSVIRKYKYTCTRSIFIGEVNGNFTFGQ
jgi:hypothetical protein